MRNEILDKALEETWRNKEKFYEDTKDFSMIEIIEKIENKYKGWSIAHNRRVYASPPEGGTGCEKHQLGVC
ncbi:MAG: hypothetical protein FWD47_15205 [Treponema sp.]|nr:hypothetical protein [Treponema sp.]